MRASHSLPCSGMQYVQRSEQRSVSEIRRSRCTRPCVSTSGAPIGMRGGRCGARREASAAGCRVSGIRRPIVTGTALTRARPVARPSRHASSVVARRSTRLRRGRIIHGAERAQRADSWESVSRDARETTVRCGQTTCYRVVRPHSRVDDRRRIVDLLDPLLLARWQFGLTTLYHFLFVPLTLGMALTVAIFQTAWFRTGKLKWLHLTRFFGKIFLINFAMGVVTGIVQEFQFGMNWSSYSRFVGDVFGAPLAFEGLMAFFFEATFIGLWIFGWDKLPKGAAPREHLDRDDRRVVLGVLHPRGERLHAEPGRLQDGRGRLARRDDRLPRGADQPGRARRAAAHALRRVHDDRGRDHLDLGLASRCAGRTST